MSYEKLGLVILSDRDDPNPINIFCVQLVIDSYVHQGATHIEYSFCEAQGCITFLKQVSEPKVEG